MRVFLLCMTCLVAIVSVPALRAKPPELPYRPVIEFMDPLVLPGEESRVPSPAKPNGAAPVAQPDPETLDVMPREIELLHVPHRAEPRWGFSRESGPLFQLLHLPEHH